MLILIAPTFVKLLLHITSSYKLVKAEWLPIPVPIDEAPVSPIALYCKYTPKLLILGKLESSDILFPIDTAVASLIL